MMTRRRGTIAPPTDARPSYLVRLSLGEDPDAPGKRIRVSKTFGTRQEAQVYLTARLGEMDRGKKVAVGLATRMRLEDWCQEWKSTWSKHLAVRTREEAIESLDRGLTKELRATKLKDLSAAMIQRRLHELSAAGLAPRTVHYFYRVLRARLEEAKRRGYLMENPLAGGAVRPPKITPRKSRTLTPAEAKLFLALCETDDLGALWATLLLTGIRPGEALALQWDDLQADGLLIRRALVRPKGVKERQPDGTEKRVGSGEYSFESTKTGRERRVPLSGWARGFLTSHKAVQNERRLMLGTEYVSQDLIFANTFGAPLQWSNVVARHLTPLVGRLALRLTGQDDTPPPAVKGQGEARRAYQERVRAARHETGLDRMRPYDSRHSAATLMISSGENLTAVSQILGHASVTTTMANYSHLQPGALEQATDRLAQTIEGAARPLRIAR